MFQIAWNWNLTASSSYTRLHYYQVFQLTLDKFHFLSSRSRLWRFLLWNFDEDGKSFSYFDVMLLWNYHSWNLKFVSTMKLMLMLMLWFSKCWDGNWNCMKVSKMFVFIVFLKVPSVHKYLFMLILPRHSLDVVQYRREFSLVHEHIQHVRLQSDYYWHSLVELAYSTSVWSAGFWRIFYQIMFNLCCEFVSLDYLHFSPLKI